MENTTYLDITILSSFSECHKFPSTIDYFETGQIKTEGIVNKVFRLEDWASAIESIRNKTAIKAIISFD
jgi:D-arabinitol dehydrogenase (NADP+)